jgi:UDP-N-acetyl-2-amino-2-deoxyglucuronate dehydrogenase
LDFGDGKMAVVDTGFSQKASKSPLLEIFGEYGTISFNQPYMTNPIPEVYIDSPEKGIRGWMKPMQGANPPKKMISQCCCLGDLIDSVENNTKPVLSAEHARHVLEIMCKIPEAIKNEKAVELTTTF